MQMLFEKAETEKAIPTWMGMVSWLVSLRTLMR